MKPLKCVCCEKEMEYLYKDAANLHNGASGDIMAGYGSRNDLNSFKISICDDCLEEKVSKGVIEHLGEYDWNTGQIWSKQEHMGSFEESTIADHTANE